MAEVNLCKCKDPIHPSNLPHPPEEYRGTAACGKCKGTIVYPYGKAQPMDVDAFVADRIARGADYQNAELIIRFRTMKALERLAEALAPEKEDRGKKGK